LRPKDWSRFLEATRLVATPRPGMHVSRGAQSKRSLSVPAIRKLTCRGRAWS
jgi:hypothetical protein